MMAGYYAVTTWVPTYLKTVRNLSVLNTGAYTAVIIIGSFVGYLVAAYLCDHIGRRKTFLLFALCTAAVAMLYTLVPDQQRCHAGARLSARLLPVGQLQRLRLVSHRAVPEPVRGSGQGFVYNFGRGLGALRAARVGYLSTSVTLAQAIGIVTGLSFGLAVLALLFLPETRGKLLLVYD